ncbi:MAG: glutamate racemase [Pyrinomonadaceae bacterium]
MIAQSINNNLPIGIFDSGVGGLTVYRALHAELSGERFVYLGDTARVPYGTKSRETIEKYSIENARFLAAHGIKLLVVACNTASALALPALRLSINIPVIGVIEPGAREAIAMSRGKKIAVIATEATIRSGAYRTAVWKLMPDAAVIERACPLFVSLAEEGWAGTEVARLVAREYLGGLNTEHSAPDTLVLGCTHYPILRHEVQEVMGDKVFLIDSGEATARYVVEVLSSLNLARPRTENPPQNRRLCDDLDHFYVTDAAERFARVAERFLGTIPSSLEAIEL